MIRLLCILLLACGLGGCVRRQTASHPVRYSFHTAPLAQELRRVAVLPLYRGPEVGASADTLDRSLGTSLHELGRYEIIHLDQAARDAVFRSAEQMLASVTPDNLRRFRERHGVDAVVVGRVDRLDPYDPIAIGLQTHLVSCRDGSTAWSASAHFDGGRRDVQHDVEAWYRATIGQGQTGIGGWQVALHSPSLFCRYVTDRVTASLLLDPEA
ncbi:MAG: hypothetical protein ACOCXJ_02060 [Planctomycetota bacterium]